MSMVKASQVELKKRARALLSIKDLFPKKRPDFRTELTPYQVKKINAALGAVYDAFGDYQNSVVPIGRGRLDYLNNAGLPNYFIGVHLPGGTKVNKKVSYSSKTGEFTYERKGEQRKRLELDTGGTEADLIRSAKKILKRRQGRRATLTANGRAIAAIPSRATDAALIKKTVYYFNKYEGMTDRGEMRTRRTASGVEYEQKAAHPHEWKMGILFEGKINGK